jgi:hypothetical protein
LNRSGRQEAPQADYVTAARPTLRWFIHEFDDNPGGDVFRSLGLDVTVYARYVAAEEVDKEFPWPASPVFENRKECTSPPEKSLAFQCLREKQFARSADFKDLLRFLSRNLPDFHAMVPLG